MKKRTVIIPIILFVAAIGISLSYALTGEPSPKPDMELVANDNLFNHGFTDIDGNPVKFSALKGKKFLIVNTASKCGYTKQFSDLQELHEKYGDKVTVIGFPANNFGGQEPLANEEITDFCQKNYGVTFLMSEKISVKGKDINPLFQFLTNASNPSFTGDIRWNFEKFLIDENGELIARFRSGVKPLDEKIVSLL
jgi:glutathione peroxidase